MILRQKKFFDYLINNRIPLLRYYYLYKLFAGKETTQQELKKLEEVGLYSNGNITKKGTEIINEIDSMFLKKTNSPKDLMGEDYLERIEKYKQLFPKITLASGKPARCSSKNLEKAFVWFFTNYDYSWEEIYKATERYIRENEDGQGKYMKTSQYFIRKDETSTLADMCETIRQGIEEVKNIKTKVV